MRLLLAACALACSFVGQHTFAQSYPTAPIQVVNPYPAGGSVDLIARRVAKKLEDRLKSPFVVTYKLGGSGSIAAGAVASAKADGYTLLMGYTNELAISPWLIKTSYTANDFEPIAFIGSTPFVLIGRKNLPASTLNEVVELGRSKEGLKYGSAGYGSLPHIGGELLKHETKMNLQHIPYKGSPQAIADLLGGHIDLIFSGIPVALEHIRAGSVRAYGVTDARRAASLPQVPTMNEGGVKNVELPGWFVLMAPKNTPAPIVKRLREATIAALAEPDMQEFFNSIAVATQVMSASELSKFLSDESEKYRGIIKSLGITAGN